MSGAGGAGQLRLRKPYVIFMGDVVDPASAKTGFGLRDWCPGDAVGQIRTATGAVDLGLPEMTVEQAARAGARAVVIGIAPDGGALKEAWTPTLGRRPQRQVSMWSAGSTRGSKPIPASPRPLRRRAPGSSTSGTRGSASRSAPGASAAASACSRWAPTALSGRSTRPSASRPSCGAAASRPPFARRDRPAS
jgi:hypothetical protein